jgi:hypothetical protein
MLHGIDSERVSPRRPRHPDDATLSTTMNSDPLTLARRGSDSGVSPSRLALGEGGKDGGDCDHYAFIG